jgi:hypothetical protein
MNQTLTRYRDTVGVVLLKILDWFKYPALMPPVYDYIGEAEPPPPKEKPKPTFPQTLSDLLDNIEATFDTYKLKFSPNSWLSRDECIGLRKLGAHIPEDGIMGSKDDVRSFLIEKNLVNAKHKPAMFLISAGNTKDVDGTLKCMFGIKHKKLPWHVKRVEGTPYVFGMAHKFMDNLFWIYAWVVITPDNKVVLCDEMRLKPVKVLNKGTYMRKEVGMPELAYSLNDGDVPKDEVVKAAFVFAFNYWVKRADRWSVSVSHRGERLTFGVDKENTKKYFANRDKSVKTESGRTKKIVHFVNEHERMVKGKVSKVREHIRGLSVFDWSGYKCVVTAPEFHYAASIKFDLAPDLEGVDVEDVSKGYMGMSKVGHLLAQREDADSMRRHT